MNAAAAHAATTHWSNANRRSGGGGTTSGQTVEIDPAFTIIGLAITVLIGAVIFMGINGPYEDRTGYYIAIGIASGVIVLAAAYLIYKYFYQQRQREDKETPSEPTPALGKRKPELPLMP